MDKRFPELRLCDNDWKSDQIAAANYQSWYTYWVKPHIVKDNEAIDRADSEYCIVGK